MNESDLAILQHKIQKILDEYERFSGIVCKLSFPEELPEMVSFQGKMVLKEHRDFYMQGYRNPDCPASHIPDKWKPVFREGQDAAKWEQGIWRALFS